MPTIPFRLRSFVTLVAILGALGLGAAVAQEATAIGTIDATLNGEAATWYFVEFATDDGPQTTASWSSIMGVMLTVSLQAHPEQRYAIEDTLSLDLTFFSPPSGCPCSYGSDAVSVMYWPESTMLENVHSSDAGGNAEATVTVFEEIAESVYRLEGTFSAEMPLLPRMNQEPDMSQVATIEGSFVVERLPELEIELP